MRLFGARPPDVLGPVRCATLALLFLAAGFATMANWAEPAGLLAGTALIALGQSLAFPALVTPALGRGPAAERAAVIGTFSAFVDVAIVGGAAGLGVTVAASGYRTAFLASAIVAAAGLRLLTRRERRLVEAAPEVAS